MEKIIIGDYNGGITVFDPHTKHESIIFEQNETNGKIDQSLTVMCISVISENKIVTGLKNGTLNLWNLTTRQNITLDCSHTTYVDSIAVCSKRQMISKSEKGDIKIWNLKTCKCIDTIDHKFIAIFPNTLLVSIFKTCNALHIWK